MRIFAKCTLLLLLISVGFTVCSCIGPPPRHRRYVTRAQITLYQGGQPQTRIYQQPKKINSVLNFLRTTHPRGKADPDAFVKGYEEEQAELGRRITEAQKRLSAVTYSDACLLAVAELAIAIGVDGHRADITVLKTAIANAAYRGSTRVEREDLLVAARLALPHRMRRRPFEEGVIDLDEIYGRIEAYEI